MKLLTPQIVKMRKRKDEIAIEKRVEVLKKEEKLLIQSINEKRTELDKLNEKVCTRSVCANQTY